MIHHYINLVCWRAMIDIYDPHRDVVWVDSVSLRKLVRRWRTDAAYRPGTIVLSQIGPGTPNGGSWYFLTAAPLPNLPPEMQYILPYFTEITVSTELSHALAGLAPGTRVGIGISAPKQNYLAAALHSLRPDLEYHCLGAAVAGLKGSYDSAPKGSHLSGSGLEWVRFLITSPTRTLRKILITAREIWSVLLQKRSRAAFKEFVTMCAPAGHYTTAEN